MSEELEWELYEMFEGGLFGFPVADHRSARQIVRHLLRRTVLYEEIADAIEESVVDLIMWLDSNGHSFIGEWVMTWINEEREEYFKEHGWSLNPDDDADHPPRETYFHHDLHYDDHDNSSMGSQTEVKKVVTCSEKDSVFGSGIKLMDDCSSIITGTTEASAESEDKKPLWEEERKKEIQMMSDMLNVYKKRLSSYDDGIDSKDNINNNRTVCQSNNDDNNIITALERDAKIKQERLNKISLLKVDDKMAGCRAKKKSNSFKKKKKELQEGKNDFTNDNVVSTDANLSNKVGATTNYSPTLTFYHKTDQEKCRHKSENQLSENSNPNQDQKHLRSSSSANIIDSILKSNDKSSSDSQLNQGSQPNVLTTSMSIDSSGGESEETLVASSSDNIDKMLPNQVTTTAHVHLPNGEARKRSVSPVRSGVNSATSTLSSNSSMLATPKNMSRIDLDHRVSSFTICAGKMSQNGGIGENSFRINTPPSNLKDYSEQQTLLGRSKGRNKFFARNSQNKSNNNQTPPTILRSLTVNDLNMNSSQQTYDLKDFFPKVNASSTSSSSGNVSIQTCSSCGSRFTTPSNSLVGNINENTSSVMPLCENCQCTIVHYST